MLITMAIVILQCGINVKTIQNLICYYFRGKDVWITQALSDVMNTTGMNL